MRKRNMYVVVLQENRITGEKMYFVARPVGTPPNVTYSYPSQYGYRRRKKAQRWADTCNAGAAWEVKGEV